MVFISRSPESTAAVRSQSAGMARSSTATAAAPARTSRRSFSGQLDRASRTASATARQIRAAGYLVAPAKPAIAPASSASRRGCSPVRTPSAKKSAATTKKATSGLMLTIELRITRAGITAAIQAAKSPAAGPARRRTSRPVSATRPSEKASVTRRPMTISAGGSTMS